MKSMKDFLKQDYDMIITEGVGADLTQAIYLLLFAALSSNKASEQKIIETWASKLSTKEKEFIIKDLVSRPKTDSSKTIIKVLISDLEPNVIKMGLDTLIDSNISGLSSGRIITIQ